MCGEAWNRKEPIVRTGVIRNVTYKRATWLGVGCSEGKTDGPERPVALARCGRSQNPHSTVAVMSGEKRGEQNHAEGRWVGRWIRNVRYESTESVGSARKGYTRRRSPQGYVDGSLGLDGADGVGAGQRRQRRTLVQFDGQGVCACDVGSGLGEGLGQSRCRGCG